MTSDMGQQKRRRSPDLPRDLPSCFSVLVDEKEDHETLLVRAVAKVKSDLTVFPTFLTLTHNKKYTVKSRTQTHTTEIKIS